MKNLIYFIVALLFFSCYNKKQENIFLIKGNIQGLNNDTLSIIKADTSCKYGYRRIHIAAKNNYFEYKGEINETTVIKMSFKNNKTAKMTKTGGFIPTKSGVLSCIAYPGANIYFKGVVSDFADAYPFDNGENDIYSRFMKQYYHVENDLTNKYLKTVNEDLSDSEKNKLNDECEILETFSSKIKVNFLDKNISSVAGLWLLDDMIKRRQIEMPNVIKYFNEVNKKYSNISYYKNIKTRIEGYKSTQIGSLIEFKTNKTIDGSIFDIKSLRGKYVIIDFWGTWCGACCAGMPHLKAFRDKHMDKVEVIAVNCGDPKKRWLKSKYTKDFDWIHIKSDKKNHNYAVNFNVQGYPTKIFIDKEGKIVFRSVGESKEFYEKIEKIITQ